ncbi:MAG TPA: hypothetical protein VMZ28_03120 [Kofleriaceae bacterium]|nr:hypothetical protein [Kofleriaceae bacterium]
MSVKDDGANPPQARDEPTEGAARRFYEPPRIVWREPYEPMSFGVSCAKQPGNPNCGPGPFSG